MTRRAFTLIELLVAILVLLAVLLASGSIFNATSKVAGVGEAVSDVGADLQAFERSVRDDLSSISRDGFLMIRCVAVRNDVRVDGSGFGALLDPGLPSDHVFRCDQLLFFREGVAGSKNYAIGAGANNQGRSSAQRIYYGHSYQLANASLPPNGQTYYDLRVTDGGQTFALIPPWADTSTLSSDLTYWSFDANSPDLGPIQTQGLSPLPTIPASSWLMSRQAVLMADDADTGSPYRYLDGPFDPPSAYWNDGVPACPSIFITDPDFYVTPMPFQSYFGISSGRTDATTMSITDAVDAVQNFPLFPYEQFPALHFQFQRKFVSASGLFWPRGEPRPPSTTRVSIPTSRHIISSSCSSFRVDWAWEDGTGSISEFPQQGESLSRGVQNFQRGDVWNPRPSNQGIGNTGGEPYFRSANLPDDPGNLRNSLLLPFLTGECDGEQSFVIPQFENRPFPNDLSILGAQYEDRLAVYEAFFGTNSSQPFVSPQNPRGEPNQDGCTGLDPSDIRQDWTPWPTALRITATIHDRLGRLQNGQTTQFIVPLPQRDTTE